MTKGTGLFGWCLPDMSKQQHTTCVVEFDYGTAIKCSCKCHTDPAYLDKLVSSLAKQKGTLNGNVTKRRRNNTAKN